MTRASTPSFSRRADPTVKLGLTNSIDFEIVFNAYQNATTRNDRTGEIVASARGFGDTVLKAKFNLVGNDGGTFAMAVVPYVKLPSAAPGLGNNVVEGGVALPAQINLPADFALALQTEVDSLKDANDARHYANFVNIANLSHALPFISKDLTASIEFFSSVGTDAFTPAGLHVRRGSGLSGPGECPARRGRQFRPHQIVPGSEPLYRDHRPFLNSRGAVPALGLVQPRFDSPVRDQPHRRDADIDQAAEPGAKQAPAMPTT